MRSGRNRSLYLSIKRAIKQTVVIYTAISLLPTIYKILSNILLSRLTPYADKITEHHQCGFRCNRSTYLFTYLLTPWCRVLLEQLTGLQLVKKFPTFHGTRRFITALTSVRHLSLSWASPIQSTYPHPTSWISILILSTHLRLGLPVVSFPPLSPPRPYTTPLLTHKRHMHSPSHSSRFYNPHNVG